MPANSLPIASTDPEINGPSRLMKLIGFTTFVVLISGQSLRAEQEVQADEAHRERLQYFEKEIRPLLHARCVKCHGENHQQGSLRLDSLEGMLKGGDSGPAAVPGKPAESLLMEAVRYESYEMPPNKPLADSEIAKLERWIADGAAWTQVDGASVRLTGAAFTEDERNFWSLQPVTHPTPPAASSDWGHNAVDRFVAARLQEHGISPAPQASRPVLIRRLYYGLLGIPPSPDELTHAASLSLNELVEQLLADPRYGEHWGRYWLDIVRYAESDGFRADFYRPEAWRYRDYVVDAFNTDKPYDVFVTEQLAGDEVAPDRGDALVATGFLRTYLYEYNQRDARTQWQDILNQVTDVTGEAFLGMGVGCARCHDHKFDPILQEDYYRLRAAFGTMVPQDEIPAADLTERQRYQNQHDEWAAKATRLQGELESVRKPYLEKAAREAIIRFPEDIQEIMAKAASDRTPHEQQLADLVQRQVLFEESRIKFSSKDQERIRKLKEQIVQLAGQEPPKLPTAMTVMDVSSRPWALHVGGNANRKAVTAGGFSILDPEPFELQPLRNSTGQRTALAKWITDPDNPLTARVIVNRVWQQHFGTGIVETASDFGSLGGRPSHPQLLDWLASELIANNWSLKWLHRTILNSSTWQMSAFHPQSQMAIKADPGNRLRWRFTIRRLRAEQIRDAMLTASGELQSEIGGPSVSHNSLRRSLYLKAMRNQPEPLLLSLDGVDGLNSISRRSVTTTPTQALNLMNGEWVRKRSAAMAKRVLDEADTEQPEAHPRSLQSHQFSRTHATKLADHAFLVALSRRAQSEEIPAAVKLMKDTIQHHSGRVTSDVFTELTSDAGRAMRIGDRAFAPPSVGTDSLEASAPFTVAGMFRLNSLYPDATVRTLISQWNNDHKQRGWAVGVTSLKSAYQPRNLILQVVGDGGYEVVASNLRPKLNTTYVVAVTVEQNADGRGRASFYLQPVGDSNTSPETAVVEFKSAAGLKSDLPVVVGGRATSARHRWDGYVDQMTLFQKPLAAADVAELFRSKLSTPSVIAKQPLTHWNFDHQDAGRAAVSDHHLQVKEFHLTHPVEQALAELCHVLLNSNEFVYLD